VLLVSLDRVAQDCQEHQREIFAKLVAIMDELVRAMRERMETLPWAHTEGAASNGATTTAAAVAALSPDESKVDECVKTVMKQTCSLHRALSDLLLPEQRDLIFRDISHRFLAQITMFVQKRDTSKQSVKSKLAYNINHIITRSYDEARTHAARQHANHWQGSSLDRLAWCLLLFVCQAAHVYRHR
jgi:hypothetical protein